eukprot:CAMPEP_0198231002 /NCGR_PEP_ID=MMETSP1445-20131203/114970_1 /TAXON_ID=36898 /ORGANISM="Pyramimonas sp., Strain CCMP2087" /LENGTH=561 /DNA_ID=CAMNT_0043911589 /DNA_START=51 /DNA_END=1736 /DNA_ORIENTATION=-
MILVSAVMRRLGKSWRLGWLSGRSLSSDREEGVEAPPKAGGEAALGEPLPIQRSYYSESEASERLRLRLLHRPRVPLCMTCNRVAVASQNSTSTSDSCETLERKRETKIIKGGKRDSKVEDLKEKPKSPETRELQESERFFINLEMAEGGVQRRVRMSKGGHRSSWHTWERPAQEQAPVNPLTKTKSTDLFMESTRLRLGLNIVESTAAAGFAPNLRQSHQSWGDVKTPAVRQMSAAGFAPNLRQSHQSWGDVKTPAVRQMSAKHSLERLFVSDKVEGSAVSSPAGLTNPLPVSDGSLTGSISGPLRFEGQISEKVVRFSLGDMETPAVRQMSASHTLDRPFISDKVERFAVSSPAGLSMTNPFPISDGSLERSFSGVPCLMGQPSEKVVLFARQDLSHVNSLFHSTRRRLGLDIDEVTAAAAADKKTPAVKQMSATHSLDRVFRKSVSDKVERSALSSPVGLTNHFPDADGSLERSSSDQPRRGSVVGVTRLMGPPSEKVVQFPREDLSHVNSLFHSTRQRLGLDVNESTAATATDKKTPAVKQMSATHSLDRLFKRPIQ